MRRLLLLRHAKAERSQSGGRDHDRILAKRGRNDAAGVGAIGGSFVLGLLLALALSILVYMAFWFAPALVVLRGAAPVAAIKQSFAGCLRNLVPFLIYGVALWGIGLGGGVWIGLGSNPFGPPRGPVGFWEAATVALAIAAAALTVLAALVSRRLAIKHP